MFLVWISAGALASSVYPTELQGLAGSDCLPACTTCHETLGGGSGTVVQPFGIAMMERGLTGGSALDLLGAAFDQVVADGLDSDEDGVTDADELAAGANPNDDTVFCGAEASLSPSYGCFNSAASPASVVGVLGGLGAVAAARRRAARR